MDTILAIQYLTCYRFGTKRWLQFLYVAFLNCLLVVTQTCSAKDQKDRPASSCGDTRNISSPFRLVTDPRYCEKLKYCLSCENNQTILNLFNGRYKVQAINYHNFTIRLVDINVDENNCSSVPRFSLCRSNFSYGRGPHLWYKNRHPYTYSGGRREVNSSLSDIIVLIRCTNPVTSDSGIFMDATLCFNGRNSSDSTQLRQYSYVHVGYMSVSDLMDSCSMEMITFLPSRNYTNMSLVDIHRELAFGFELSWHNANCNRCPTRCYVNNKSQVRCGLFPVLSLSLSAFLYATMIRVAICVFIAPCIFVFLIHKFRRRHYSAYDVIEDFLHDQNNLMPIRYSYSNIKKMTANFKEKLGEGGFGSVYKGKLRSGNLAAIKLLGKSKSSGQDFINEVATIGRIHHTNVVQLIGYCVEGSRHALVYDFMPNGSLDKYIFCKEGYVSLTWEKLYNISLGIACGIEYLHRGCEMQILHFDIKPHNILLDENFNPKVSDFGLAKLYQTNNSIKTITTARGTIGYMAPELLYKNIGRVSYKVDVYSFGMMLLEIVGKRKNLNAEAEKTSEIYFPLWIYDQLAMKKAIEASEVEKEENKMIKKMIMVGLWCIQMRPTDRPSMRKVIKMFEGDLENLQLPPKPLLYPEETPVIMDQSFEKGTTSSDDSL